MNRLALMIAATMPAIALAQDVEVFGQPLGGVLSHKVQECHRDFSKRTSLCWIDKPHRAADGSSFGTVDVPDKYQPSWILGLLPKVVINKESVLVSMNYSTDALLWRNRTQIVAGITSRFGVPKENSYGGTYSATWMPNGAKIELGCVYAKCHLSLLSKAENLRVEQALKKREERPSSL